MESSGDKIKFPCTDWQMGHWALSASLLLHKHFRPGPLTAKTCSCLTSNLSLFAAQFPGYSMPNHHFTSTLCWKQLLLKSVQQHGRVSYEYPHNTRQESLLPQNAWDLNRQGRWWVGRRRGAGKGSDLLGAKPSVNISPASSELYLCSLCTAWVFPTYWTSILWMPLEFQY